ncbi:hypothetical protein G7L40_00485 [Paenibacillus polymyxa]|uniref:Uncharacterized protein n=1 Tax=Paenibacillus polymyxa TaxID=1406 RepID=A0A378XV61_PAEPO|nr:hypothetical protein [Paenibacillus polymyxa]MBE7897187.1 hypothetical protein [Paenibacillus polymyxa]MBG9763043.1 hypothetical protein [Paenibacillus polymyxa]MCC3257563.1 hypothetical protein [Paenibacillus polymyxa]QPK51352.1 hypothetical protein G7035_00485 [Paenibacillus polymyxa]QPK56442.1 hypothetical protein G7L40_00485 [Paenibacillus polymyxa]
MGDRYGSREIMDVVLKDVRTGEPKAYLESLTTSSLEFQGSSVYARGGKGHPKLIGWDSEKDATMNMEDALISKESLGVLTGSEFKAGAKPVHKKEVITAGTGGTIELTKEPLASKKSFFFKTTNGTVMDEKLVAATPVSQSMTFAGLTEGDRVIADYYYNAPTTTKSLTITSDIFPGTYLLEGTTLWRTEDGVDVEALYTIPKLKVQPNFKINMASSGDPQPFTFTCEVLKDTNSTAMVIIDVLEDE